METWRRSASPLRGKNANAILNLNEMDRSKVQEETTNNYTFLWFLNCFKTIKLLCAPFACFSFFSALSFNHHSSIVVVFFLFSPATSINFHQYAQCVQNRMRYQKNENEERKKNNIINSLNTWQIIFVSKCIIF